MTYYLLWWLAGFGFSLWGSHLEQDVTLGGLVGLLLICIVFGPIPGFVYILIALNSDNPVVVWRKKP